MAEDGRMQTVLEHLTGTAERCAAFAAPFGAAEQGKLAGLAHDIGKYSKEFQRRLQGGPRVDHATAGALACMEQRQPFAAFAVLGHHGGLPDGGGQGESDGNTFLSRLNRAARGGIPDCSPWKEEVCLPQLPPARQGNPPDMVFFTRMLYSCLVDADYLDTEAFMDGRPRSTVDLPMDVLWNRLRAYIYTGTVGYFCIFGRANGDLAEGGRTAGCMHREGRGFCQSSFKKAAWERMTIDRKLLRERIKNIGGYSKCKRKNTSTAHA